MNRISRCLGAVLLVGVPQTALAQAPSTPESVVPKALGKDSIPRLCEDGSDILLPRALLGEIALLGAINSSALPPAPKLASGDIDRTAEANLAAWIVATKDLREADVKQYAPRMTVSAYSTLNNVRIDLVDYVIEASEADTKLPYRLTEGSQLGDRPETNRGRVIESLFGDVLGGGRQVQVQLKCVREPAPGQSAKSEPALTIVLRGKIDDVAVLRRDTVSGRPSPAFAKASEAKLAYTDNDVKGEESVSAEMVLAVGRQITPYDGLYGFVHYMQNSTETDIAGDDDDSKDVRAISPGILYRRSLINDGFAATAGATVYRTMDLAQDSRLLRTRVFLSDIAISRGQDKGDVCGGGVPLAKDWYGSCSLGLFAELGRVQDAGTSIDLAADEDDEYVGVGANIGFALRTEVSEQLKPFSLSFEYRWMRVVSGELKNTSRFLIELGYKIPDSNVSITLSRAAGENFETFQDEDINKLAIGWKY